MIKKVTVTEKSGAPIRLGYVRLLDAAPVIVAESRGYFRDHGLNVQLQREVGWATIRDRLTFGELDFAQALGPMAFAMNLGVGVAASEVVALMVLNRNGNAITLSKGLWDEGVQDGNDLRRRIQGGYHQRKLVFGVVSLASSHFFLLCHWLETLGIHPVADVVITVLPPEQMVRNLEAGNIDGYCVGEPWNSLAVKRGIGWCPAVSEAILPGYPEKVLISQRRLISYRPEETAALIQALQRSCAYCDEPQNRDEVIRILAQKKYLDCEPELLWQAFGAQFDLGNGRVHKNRAFIRFHADASNCPDYKSGERILTDMSRYYPGLPAILNPHQLITQVFLENHYRESLAASLNYV